ncbi:MAG: hypothetical protein K2X91_09295, partial [Thermoleophilia bacterium]|nr:hypothetical protein [Thermoleophilia bacterium]
KDRNEDGDKGDKNENPLRSIANLLDSDSDKALSAAEVRQVVSTAVGAIYDTADEDRDGKMSPDEWNNAAYGLARSAVETAFQAADKDNDRALSRDEFTEALAEPTRTAFSILDADGDGKLTGRELEQTGRVLGSQLRSIRIPQAKNSPDRLIREGRADEIIKAGGESRTEKRDDDR